MARYKQPVNVKVKGINALIKELEKLSHDKAMKAARSGTVKVSARAKEVMKTYYGSGDDQIQSTGTTEKYLDKKIVAMTRTRRGYMGIVGPATKLYGINLPDLKRLRDPKKYKKRSKMRKLTIPTKVFHLYDQGTTERNFKGIRSGKTIIRKEPRPTRGVVRPRHIVKSTAAIIQHIAIGSYQEAFQRYLIR